MVLHLSLKEYAQLVNQTVVKKKQARKPKPAKAIVDFVDGNKILQITGRIPSKKNSKIMICRGKFPTLLPSKNYSEWHKEASKELMLQKPPQGVKNCSISIMFVPPDERYADLSNKAESIMDLLVDNHVIQDDNWWVVKKLDLEVDSISKNPKAVITIKY
jgi:Holliday junction resolvase RusA-like endonuclease